MPSQSRRKSLEEQELESNFKIKINTTNAIASVIKNLTRWGGAVCISYIAYLTVKALAGQDTFAKIGVSFLSDIRISEALAWILGGSCAFYGWRQRALRKDTVERLQERIRMFETQIDPDRTSSKLTPRGDTRPEDKQ